MRSAATLMRLSICVLVLVAAAGCSPRPVDPLDRTFAPDDPISAERLGAEFAARAGTGAAQDVAYLVAGAMISRCDTGERDGLLTSPAERACLRGLTIDDAWAAGVTDVLNTPPALSEPGWLTTLLLALAIVLAAPWAIDRSVRVTGWRLAGFSRGRWFRLGPVLQLVVALVAGALVYALVLAVLIWLNVGWSHWWERGLPFYHLAKTKIRILSVVAALDVLIVWFGIVDASSRIKGLLAPTSAPAADPAPPRVAGATATPTPTSRNIVICCDGTGNRAEGVEDGRRAVSNVRKFFEVAKSDVESEWLQDKWYDDGVGTGTSGEGKRLSMLEKLANWLAVNTPAKVLGTLSSVRAIAELGFGVGITENITQGYAQLVRMYRPGDRIFIVGFSRGAYTARCIADVIDDIGLLKPEHVRYAPDIIQLYRYRQSPEDGVTLRAGLTHDDVGVHFLGLWDTVASLGVPLWGWSFSIFKLWSNRGFGVTCINSCHVIRHALSMDEQRSQFFPTLFDEPVDPADVTLQVGSASAPVTVKRLEQRWFRGSHAGVGGGYADTSLSDIALAWIIEEAVTCGLLVHEAWDRTVLTRTDQVFYPNPIGQVITELERQKAWRVSGAWPRWHPCVFDETAGYGVLDDTVGERAARARGLRPASAPVSNDELVTLAPGERVTVGILAHLGWNRSGVVFEQGARYRITWTGGQWQDKEKPYCGPSGQEASMLEARRFLGWGRRVRRGRWMELIGHVAHPRAWDMQERGGSRLLYYLLFREPHELTRSLIPLGRHLKAPGDGVEVSVEAPGGLFYGYANDWWLAYDNNSGSVTLSVERLANDAPPQSARYIVDAEGIVLDANRKAVGL